MVVMASTTAFERLLARIQGVLNARDLVVEADEDQIRTIVTDEVESYQRSAYTGADGAVAFHDPDDIAQRLMAEITGVGAEIEALIADAEVEEIFGTDGDLTYRTTGGETRAVPTPVSATAVLNTVQRLVASASEQLDASHPRADGIRVILPGGRQGRLSASIPPRIDGTVSFVLRLPQKMHVTLDDLVAWGSLTAPAAQFLRVLMRIPRPKILVAGPPGAGKTALLDALLRAITARQRTIVLEEERELTAPLLLGEYWATSKVEDLPILIRSARVSSPQMIVLGELKGAEAWDLLMAGNLGTGVIAAVHADSTAKAFDSLADAASPAMPAMTTTTIREKFSRTFNVVVYCGMDTVDDKAIRQISEISVVPPQLSVGAVAVTPIFARDAVGEAMQLRSTDVGADLEYQCNRALRRLPGITLNDLLHGAEVHL
jgi:pilus assembly protein CpaF